MMHADGKYWLAVEYKQPAPRVLHKLSAYPRLRSLLDRAGVGGIWKTAVFVSEDPVEGFSMTDDSPILTGGVCAMHFRGPNDERYYLYYNEQEPQWHQHVQVHEIC
jgi:hypothetical protein